LGKSESLLIGSRKSSPAVDGNTAAQTLGQCNKPLERPITCVHLRRKTSELEGEEYKEAKQSCRWNVPELRKTCYFGCRLPISIFNCQQILRKKTIEEKVDNLNCQGIPRKKTSEEIIYIYH
jgi:hypothetical protein